jgi:hypothetical protein
MSLNVEDGCLGCPLCGSNNGLHLDSVSVAGRVDGEDTEAVALLVDGRGRTTPISPGTPHWPESRRRHAFALNGWCEICGDKFSIELAQHKGQTLVNVRANPFPLAEGLDRNPDSDWSS